MTIPPTLFAFVLGACRGDENRAHAVIECMFFDDQAVAAVARFRGLNERTLRYQVTRIRGMLRTHGRRLLSPDVPNP